MRFRSLFQGVFRPLKRVATPLMVLGVMAISAIPAFADGGTAFVNTDAPDYTVYASSCLVTLAPILLYLAGVSILVAAAIWAIKGVGRMFGVHAKGIH